MASVTTWSGQAVDDQVAGREDHVRRLDALGLVLGQPGELGRHCAGVERDAGARPVDVVAPHALGQPRASAAARWSDHRMPLPIGSPCRGDGDEGLPGPRAGHDVDLGERLRRLGPGLGAGDDERSSTSAAGPARSSRPAGCVVAQLGAGQRDQPAVAPEADLGDGRPEVDGEDHRAVHQLRDQAGHLGRVGVLVERASHGHAGSPARHDVAHLVEDRGRVRPRCAGRRGRGRARRRWPPPGPPRAGARHRAPTAGTGTLITGAPMSWAMTAASTMASVSRRIRPSCHTSGSIRASSSACACLLEHLAQQLERGRRDRVVQVDAASCA